MPHLIDWPNYPSDPDLENAYFELDCPVLPKIQEETLEWVHKNTNFFHSPEDTSFWHQIPYADMGRSCPSLMAYMKSIRTPIREIAVGVLTEGMGEEGLKLHVGNPKLQVKINFPIYNTEDVYTEWYALPVDDMDKTGIRPDENSDYPVYNLWKLNSIVESTYPCIARYNMHDHPIVFNSWIPHRVVPGPNVKYPRIMIACMPFNEPVHFLKKK